MVVSKITKAALYLNEKKEPYQLIENAELVLKEDSRLDGRIKYNTLAYSPFVVGSLPWDPRSNREWTNADDSAFLGFAEREYKLKSKEKILTALDIVANENKFNPVVDMLKGIHENKWDHQTGHIARLLPDYLGAERTRYTEEVMKLFMLGAVSRAFNPGCKFDYMLVLIGAQGACKSTFLQRLAMQEEFFDGNLNTIEGDKAAEKLRGKWILEMAELLATRRAKDVESIKAFITNQTDNYRPAYGRRTESHPRMCVFAGTTNKAQFLTDITGNRRFLPVQVRKECSTIDLFRDREQADRDIMNAWGEAVDLFMKADQKPELLLPADLIGEVERIQEAHTEEDTRIGIIQRWLDETTEKRVCAAMIFKEALEYSRLPERHESNQIMQIMDNKITGWQRVQTISGKTKVKGYGVQYAFERIPELSSEGTKLGTFSTDDLGDLGTQLSLNFQDPDDVPDYIPFNP